MIGAGALRRRRDQHGAAAVEFALVVTPLLILVMGIISYGYMLSFRQSISQAAAEGARAAAVAPATADRPAIAEAVIGEVLGAVCNQGHLTCTQTTPTSCATCIAVTVTYAYLEDDTKPVFLGIGLVMPEQLTYTAVAEISQ